VDVRVLQRSLCFMYAVIPFTLLYPYQDDALPCFFLLAKAVISSCFMPSPYNLGLVVHMEATSAHVPTPCSHPMVLLAQPIRWFSGSVTELTSLAVEQLSVTQSLLGASPLLVAIL